MTHDEWRVVKREGLIEMTVFLMFVSFFLACFSTSFGTNLTVPNWQNLECEVQKHTVQPAQVRTGFPH